MLLVAKNPTQSKEKTSLFGRTKKRGLDMCAANPKNILTNTDISHFYSRLLHHENLLSFLARTLFPTLPIERLSS